MSHPAWRSRSLAPPTRSASSARGSTAFGIVTCNRAGGDDSRPRSLWTRRANGVRSHIDWSVRVHVPRPTDDLAPAVGSTFRALQTTWPCPLRCTAWPGAQCYSTPQGTQRQAWGPHRGRLRGQLSPQRPIHVRAVMVRRCLACLLAGGSLRPAPLPRQAFPPAGLAQCRGSRRRPSRARHAERNPPSARPRGLASWRRRLHA